MVKWHKVHGISTVVQDLCKHSVCDRDHGNKNYCQFPKVFNLKYEWGMVFFREFLAYSDDNVQVYKWVPEDFTNKRSHWVGGPLFQAISHLLSKVVSHRLPPGKFSWTKTEDFWGLTWNKMYPVDSLDYQTAGILEPTAMIRMCLGAKITSFYFNISQGRL